MVLAICSILAINCQIFTYLLFVTYLARKKIVQSSLQKAFVAYGYNVIVKAICRLSNFNETIKASKIEYAIVKDEMSVEKK